MMMTMFIHDHCVSRSEFFQSSQFCFPASLTPWMKRNYACSVVTMREGVFPLFMTTLPARSLLSDLCFFLFYFIFALVPENRLSFFSHTVFYFLAICLLWYTFSHSFPAMNEDHERYDLCTAECVVDFVSFLLRQPPPAWAEQTQPCRIPSLIARNVFYSGVPRKTASIKGGVLRLCKPRDRVYIAFMHIS